MMKKILYMALPLMAVHTSAWALTPVFADIQQNVQQALVEGQNAVAVAQTGLNEIQTLKTTALNGVAGVKNAVADLQQLPQVYLTSFKNKANSLVNSTMQSVLGTDIVGDWSAQDLIDFDLDKLKDMGLNTDIIGGWSANDVMNLDADKLKSMGLNELEGLGEDQLRKLLGDQLSGKLSASQIKEIANDPKKAIGLLSGLMKAKQTQQGAASKPSKGLEGLGMKGSTGMNTTSVQTTSMGPDGNRSDAFNGTGNASTAQFAEAQEVFTEMRTRIEEKMQLPKTQEEALKMTTAQLEEISLLQIEAEKELGVQGLAMSWIRQEVTKQRLPKQEEAITKLFNEKATDERGTIQLVSALSIMTAEAQNYASTVYAVDLTAFGTQVNRRTGDATSSALSKEDLGGGSSAPASTDTTAQTGSSTAPATGETAQ